MKRWMIAILLLLVHAALWAQDACTRSTEGTDFWFGFMENRNDDENRYMEITVTAREATTFRITVGNVPYGGEYQVGANDSRQVKLDWQVVETLGSETIQNKGIHLTSEKPVNVYALNWDINSADVAVVYPKGSLGLEYYAMCYNPDIDPANPVTGNGRNSEFLVVATENNTRIEITPSVVTHLEKPAHVPFSVTLSRGQVYQVQSENDWGSHLEGQGDLTGSYIKADKPVALYSGSLATRVPGNVCCWDHLYEQMPPLHSWGLEYFTIPLRTRRGDRYRVMASENNTTVYVGDRTPQTIGSGQFMEFVISDGPKRILADKPVMVTQYSQSNDIDSAYTDGNGDPFMIVLSSSVQSKKNVTFVAYDSENIEHYFVNIITPTSEVPGIRLDGSAITGDFSPVPGNEEYSYAQKIIDAGTHNLQNPDGEKGFLAYVYAYGGVESYGYGVGFNLDLVLDLGESVYFDGDTLLLCYGDTLVLDAGSYFDHYAWDSGEQEQRIRVTEAGFYKVSTTTNTGCYLEDSVYVYASLTETDLGPESETLCHPQTLMLEAGEGYASYIWQDQDGDTLATSNTFTVNLTGSYILTVADQFQCEATDSVRVVVHPTPETNIDDNILICGSRNTQLNIDIGNAPDSIWNIAGNFSWTAADASAITLNDQSRTHAEAEVSDWGRYDIYYQLTTIDNCIVSDTITASFYPKPSSDFEFTDNTGEICNAYNREVLYTGDARSGTDFMWDFGGSMVLDTLGENHFVISLGIADSSPLLNLVVNDNGCLSDTTSQLIGSHPDFTMTASGTRGCDSVLTLFEGNLQGGDPLRFEWNFGDNSPLNQQQNPSHFYPDTGFYDVSLKIVNETSGCAVGFVIDSMVKVFPTPLASIAVDQSTCHNDTLELLYTNRIDSTLAEWWFEGMHQWSGENDSIIVVLDKPFSTVRLSVDEYGCVSDTISMTLKRKPVFDFDTESTSGCIPFTAQINAIPMEEDLTFQWITDSLPYPQGENITFGYAEEGAYNVGLIAGSGITGCTDTLIKKNWIVANPRPEAYFWVNYPVALIDRSTITFNNTTENALFYFWEFGDGTESVEMNPVHTYNNADEYVATLVAENQFGCTDTAAFNITILPGETFAPNAFRPDSPIEVNRTFMPVGKSAWQRNFSLRIYDRWGQLIYETDRTDKPWDGTTRTGLNAPGGNYIWIARYEDVQGFEHEQKGQVLLVR